MWDQGPVVFNLNKTNRIRGQLFELTTSFVNVSLKLKIYILQIHCYFGWNANDSHFSKKQKQKKTNKKNSVVDNVVGIYLHVTLSLDTL